MKTTYDTKVNAFALDRMKDFLPPLTDEMLAHHADILACDVQRLVDNYFEAINDSQQRSTK